MKQTLLSIFLLARLALMAQSRPPAGANPDSSAIGDPIGEKALKTIGPEGGRIISTDGNVELVFPPGALATPTGISVQPVQNMGAGGLGNAYACEPDGIQFQKPVQLIIHYSDSVCKGLAPQFHIIRWQDSHGRWFRLEETKPDSINRTVTGYIRHFSTYSDVSKWHIGTPGQVKLGKKRYYHLEIMGAFPDGVEYSPLNTPARDKFWANRVIEWAVNGVPGGNETYGTIQPASDIAGNYADYHAPLTMPPHNVVISAEYEGDVQIGPNVSISNPKVTLTVVLFDDYHYMFYGNDQVGLFHMIDSATCDIHLESSGALRLSNLKNPVPWSDWPPESKRDKCTFQYPDRTNWKGMVQIDGLADFNYDVTQDGKMTVFISLRRTMGSSPRYIEHCKKTRTIASMPIAAQPDNIQFEVPPDGTIMVKYKGRSSPNFIDGLVNDQGFYIHITHID